jgi:hypothetical protein
MRRIEFIMSDLFKYSPQTYFNHKKEKRPILELLEKYFGKEDIEEFLNTGKIQKFENITFIVDKYLSQLQTTYLNSFKESQSLLHEPSMHNEFRDFYFNFLTNFEKIDFPFNINVLGIQSLLTHYLYQHQTQKIKENLNTDKIYQKLEEKNSEIDEAINSTNGQERKELERFKENLEEETQKEEIVEDIFSENESNFQGIMLHFFTFNSWNNDMYYFLELVKKDEFDYFINSKNDELLYQAIGYLVYSHYKNLDMHDKLLLIDLTYHYFLGNINLISKENIKKHILERVNNPKVFKEIDEQLCNDYCKKTPPDNHTSNFDINFENEEIETVIFEDLVKKDMERKLKN